MTEDGYIKEEAIKDVSIFPEKGPVCLKCRTRIPVFADLSPEQEAEVRELIAQHKPMGD